MNAFSKESDTLSKADTRYAFLNIHTYMHTRGLQTYMHARLGAQTYIHTLLRAKFSKNQGGDFVKAERPIFKGKLTFFVQISIGRFSVDPEGQNILIGVSQLY